MIAQFENLTNQETELLFKAPVLVSLLAASWENKLSKAKKAEAYRLAHLKTFTANPILRPYYRQVEKNFNIFFQEAVKKYAPFSDKSREALRNEIHDLNSVIAKLDSDYAKLLHKSLAGYAAHVKKADRVILDDFIFPLPIPGLTD